MTGLVNSATIKLQGIEMDVLEEKTQSEIVADYGFANTGALRDFLLGQGARGRTLWSQFQRLKTTNVGRPPKHQSVAAPARVQVPPLHQERRPTAPPPTSPPKEAPMGQTLPEQYTEAGGNRRWSDGRPITYGDRVWSYVVHGKASPKKRTAAKAQKIEEMIDDLIKTVDEEAEEVKAMKRIAELRAQLAEEEAKLKGKPKQIASDVSTAEVRAWAKENYLGEVPERGALPAKIHDAYAEAHK